MTIHWITEEEFARNRQQTETTRRERMATVFADVISVLNDDTLSDEEAYRITRGVLVQTLTEEVEEMKARRAQDEQTDYK